MPWRIVSSVAIVATSAVRRSVPVLVVAAVAAALLTACAGPYRVEVVEEVQPSETAFLLQLEGAAPTDAALQGADFLERLEVPAGRVTIPTRKRSTGRMPWSYEWLPTAKLVRVDRKPVTRTWTKGTAPGSPDLAVYVESRDSIGFGVGVSVTTSIPEERAATFLAHHAGKSLAEVTDESVRGFVQSELSREFGELDLGEVRAAKGRVMDDVLPRTRAFFAPLGVSIDYMGFAEGLAYEDARIQEAIDRNFTAEMDVISARQEALAQEERNRMIVSRAVAEREAAQEFAKSREAAEAKARLEIDRTRADAQQVAASRWDGALPAQILPAGSPLLFGMDAERPR